jgi:hypothetical protein
MSIASSRVLLRVRSSASSFNLQCPLFYLRSSSRCLRLLRRLPVTSILPSIFPSVTCFRMQFLLCMWPFQSVFLLFIVCRIFLSSLTRNSLSVYRHLIGSALIQNLFKYCFRNFISAATMYLLSDRWVMLLGSVVLCVRGADVTVQDSIQQKCAPDVVHTHRTAVPHSYFLLLPFAGFSFFIPEDDHEDYDTIGFYTAPISSSWTARTRRTVILRFRHGHMCMEWQLET